MCAIAGFYNPHDHYLKEKGHHMEILASMSKAQKHRGPDDAGLHLNEHGGLSHARLSVIDLAGGRQPMVKSGSGQTFAIVYNGELYNAGELRRELIGQGHVFQTSSDTEIILEGYMESGPGFVKRLNGIFAFAILDTAKNRLCLFRDRAGVKPLFYMARGEEIIFASEPKGIFAYPGIRPVLDKKGLNEIFSLGPARTSSCGVPICTFLSGGVDSSLVSAICASELKKQGKRLTTFSFDFAGNDRNFKANAFQPSQDRPFVDRMVRFLDSDHHYLECDSLTQADRLYDSVLAHDLPAMGDIDSSMLQFCSMVKEHSKVALTGECADEIFGGYPWFHKKECLKAHTFPWTMDLEARKLLLDDDFLHCLDMDGYVKDAYERSVAETPRLPGDTPAQARRREIAWLNLGWFMQTLLNRMDRASMYSGLEARVPFADHRLLEYVWNVPWDMKARDGIVKNLLRQSAKGLLPEDILFRRKSPYPKTYDTSYEKLLAGRVREMMSHSRAPVMQFLDRRKLERFLSSPGDYGKPWYGQLMAGPQMMAYILQVNYWLETYHIRIERV